MSRKKKSHNPSVQDPDRSSCHHLMHDGRRCRMSPSLFCIAHSQHSHAAEDLLTQILGQSGEMITTVSINRVLRNLFVAVLRKRITSRDAFVLARVCSLLLRTLEDVRWEVKTTHGPSRWVEVLEHAIKAAESDQPVEAPPSDEMPGIQTTGKSN